MFGFKIQIGGVDVRVGVIDGDSLQTVAQRGEQPFVIVVTETKLVEQSLRMGGIVIGVLFLTRQFHCCSRAVVLQHVLVVLRWEGFV